MIASKFQPTYARQAFPCFDEPDFKATYDITLAKPTDYMALSNMNVRIYRQYVCYLCIFVTCEVTL